MKSIDLSIIIPIYNAEKYIKRCIESILISQNKALEVIAVDDGSADQSLHICLGLANADSRVHVYSKENGGVSSARNLGLEKAKGRYITFCDADDYYEDRAIDYLLSFIERGGRLDHFPVLFSAS